MKREMMISSCCGLAAMLAVPAIACADAASVPDWTYDAITSLADAGYVTLPDGGVQGLSREQMAALTARALKRMDDVNNLQTAQTGTDAVSLTREYTAVTRLSVQDEMQERALKDWVSQLQGEYKTAFNAVKSDMRESARYSGQTGDAAQQRLRHRQNSEALDKAAVQLANAEAQLKRHEVMMQQTQSRKQALEQQMVSARLPVEGGSSADADVSYADTANEDVFYADEGSAAGSLAATDDALLRTAGNLRVEFASELADMGYFDDVAAQSQAVAQTTPPQAPPIKRLRIDGEVRADYGHNTGPESIGNRGRLRLRGSLSSVVV